MIDRPLPDARDSFALGRVGLGRRQVDRNNPAHARNLAAPATARRTVSRDLPWDMGPQIGTI
ncbi:hypothetical protein Pen02_72490 [Plantactinospora endophytica]|uniref:Uncharacterized protein n=1 Tax=Plantactinospora endophytica TaxID=673535 RepID=A0ABQ4EC51_9ACTN|nr:hypothetical protein Pen02_72490 [Plantactinospora endophytica]